MRRNLGLLALAAGLCLVVACEEMPLEQQKLPAPQRTFTARGRPQLHPNSQKYREQSQPIARGRSGTASLAMIAVMTMARETSVHLSTGDLYDANAAGTISNVQLKSRTQLIKLVDNFNKGAAGIWSAQAPGVELFVPITAQAIVRGIDGKRSDVVTVTDIVRWAPSLSVRSVVPRYAAPDAPVALFATITNHNADLGARTDCVLSVDGVVVDRADNVWVADGTTVDCAFSYAFPEGDHRVTIEAANVRPAEWYPQDNISEHWIHVARVPLHGTLQFQEARDSTWSKSVSHSEDPWHIYGDSIEYYQVQHGQRINFLGTEAGWTGWWRGPLDITLKVYSDGALLELVRDTVTWFPYEMWAGPWRVWAGDNSRNCGPGWSGCQYQRFLQAYRTSSRYIYYSAEYYKEYWCDPDAGTCDGYEYGWSSNWAYDSMDFLALGNSLTLDATVAELQGLIYGATASLTVPEFTTTSDERPYACDVWGCWGFYEYRWIREAHESF